MLSSADLLELRRLRWDKAALKFELATVKLALALRYDEHQPRVPPGHPNGGQWTAGGGGRFPRDDASHQPQSGEPHSEKPRSVDGDQASSGWRTVSTPRHADGSIAQETAVNSDGYAIRSEYPKPGTERFDERHTVRAPDGTIRNFETKDGVQTI